MTNEKKEGITSYMQNINTDKQMKITSENLGEQPNFGQEQSANPKITIENSAPHQAQSKAPELELQLQENKAPEPAMQQPKAQEPEQTNYYKTQHAKDKMTNTIKNLFDANGKFQYPPSDQVEHMIKRTYHSDYPEDKKWEFIKELNKLHIYAIVDEKEKAEKAEKERIHKWVQSQFPMTSQKIFGYIEKLENLTPPKELREWEHYDYEQERQAVIRRMKDRAMILYCTEVQEQIKQKQEQAKQNKYHQNQIEQGKPIKTEQSAEIGTTTYVQALRTGGFDIKVEKLETDTKNEQKLETSTETRVEKKDDKKQIADYSFWNNYAKEIYQHQSVDDGLTVSERIDMLLRNFSDDTLAQILSSRGQQPTEQNITRLKTAVREQMSFDSRGNDAIIISGSVGASLKLTEKFGAGAGFGGGVIYSPMLDESFPMLEGNAGVTTGGAFSGQILGLRIIELQSIGENEEDIKANSIKNANVLREVLKGVSWGGIVSYGASFGVLTIENDYLKNRFMILVVGLGTAQIGGLGISNSETAKEYIARRTENPEEKII